MATKTTAQKIEAARAEFKARKTTHDVPFTPESEHATETVAPEVKVELAPSWTRRIIGFVSGIIAAASTYYWGATLANVLIAAAGTAGFIPFVVYVLGSIIVYMATAAAGYLASTWVTHANTSSVTGFFGSLKAKFTEAKAAV